MNKINMFKGEYAFLSNFYESPFVVNFDKIKFNIFPEIKSEYKFTSVEVFYQAFKAKHQKDFVNMIKIHSPRKSKKFGRKIELRDDWFKINKRVMLYALIRKFTQNKKLGKMLVDTGNTLIVEGNYWHDNYWGNCYCSKCKSIKGKNYLGKMLMFIRENLYEENKTKTKEFLSGLED